MSAFTSHNDMKGPNSLDMYVTEDEKNYVRHYLIDFGSTLGTGALGRDKPFKGYLYTLIDFKNIFLNIFTLGLYVHPWERSQFPDIKGIGTLDADTYDPGSWKPSRPNPALLRATNLDGYWGAKILMSFTDEHVRAIVKEAKFSDPRAEEYMSQTLIQRRDKTGRYWYGRVNPLDRFAFSDKNILRFDDMAVVGGLEKSEDVKYQWKLEHRGDGVKAITDYVEIESTQITFTPDIIESMEDIIQKSEQADNPRNRVFSIDIQTKRTTNPKWSKSVRSHFYYSPEGDLKLIGIEREG